MKEAIVTKLNGIKAEAEKEMKSMYTALDDYKQMSNSDWIQHHFGSDEIIDERGVDGVVSDCIDVLEKDLRTIELVEWLIKNDKTFKWMETKSELMWGWNWNILVDKYIETIWNVLVHRYIEEIKK